MTLLLLAERQHEQRPVSDYHIAVRISTSVTSTENLGEFLVQNHRRDDGWPVLLAKFLLVHFPNAFDIAKEQYER